MKNYSPVSSVLLRRGYFVTGLFTSVIQWDMRNNLFPLLKLQTNFSWTHLESVNTTTEKRERNQCIRNEEGREKSKREADRREKMKGIN